MGCDSDAGSHKGSPGVAVPVVGRDRPADPFGHPGRICEATVLQEHKDGLAALCNTGVDAANPQPNDLCCAPYNGCGGLWPVYIVDVAQSVDADVQAGQRGGRRPSTVDQLEKLQLEKAWPRETGDRVAVRGFEALAHPGKVAEFVVGEELDAQGHIPDLEVVSDQKGGAAHPPPVDRGAIGGLEVEDRDRTLRVYLDPRVRLAHGGVGEGQLAVGISSDAQVTKWGEGDETEQVWTRQNP